MLSIAFPVVPLSDHPLSRARIQYPPLESSPAACLAAELSEIAAGSPALASYRAAAFELLDRRIGFDGCLLYNTRSAANGRGFELCDAELNEGLASWLYEWTPQQIEGACREVCVELDPLFVQQRRTRTRLCRSLFGPDPAVLGFAYAPQCVAGIALRRVSQLSGAEMMALRLAMPVHAVAEGLLTLHAREPVETWARRFQLTERQHQIVALVVRGLTNAEVAGVLHCSTLTVRNHLVSVFQKAGSSSRAELIFQALSSTITQPLPRGYAHLEHHAKAGARHATDP